jgi:hypothetical protein
LKEKGDLQKADVAFMVGRTQFTIDNFKITSTFSNSSFPFDFIKAVYLQTNTVFIKNIDFIISGYLFESFDPLSMNVQNIDVDFYKMLGRFVFLTTCNYPEANLANDVTFENITVHNSQTKTVTTQSSFISFSSGANFTLSNADVSLYTTNIESISPIKLNTNAN